MIEDIKSGRKKCNKYVTNAKKWVYNERNITEEAGKLVDIYKALVPEDVLEELI